MIKVFIADDERYVVELLLNLIDWNDLGLEIVGVANDGITALEKIEQLEPHIIITDIRMPGLNGLELIQKAQQFNPKAAFIIISGHKNFQYAQTAVRYGVKDYLLKPILKEDLTTILSQLTGELNRSKIQSEAIVEMNKSFSTAKSKIHDALLDYIMEKNELPYGSFMETNREYILNFNAGAYLFLIFKADYKSFSEEMPMLKLMRQNVLSNIKQFIEPLCYETLCKVSDSKFVLLCNYDLDNHQAFMQNLHNILSKIKHDFQKFGNLYLAICKGSIQTDFSSIVQSYHDAQRAFKSRIIVGLDTIIEAPPAYSSKIDLQTIFSVDAQDGLMRSIEKFDPLEIKTQVVQLFSFAESAKIEYADFYWDLCTEIYSLFLNATQHLGLLEDIGVEIEDLKQSLEDCISINSMKLLIIQRITANINRYKNFDDITENISVTIAKRFISEHYKEKITLNKIAQLVFLNSVYFSILFKRETGINFVDYLNKYRIEVSKKQLKDMSFSLSDIADSVGFANAKYFSKIFKKIVGITPSQYRSKYIRHSTDNSHDESLS